MNNAAGLLLGAALALVSEGVLAEAPLEAGDGELALGGALIRQDDCCGGDLTTLGTEVTYGHFLTRNHELGASISLFWVDSSTFGDDLNGAIGPFYKYNFVSDSLWVPFIAGQANVQVGEGGDFREITYYDASLGVNYFVTPTVAITAELFRVWSDSAFGLDAAGIRWGYAWFTKR